MCPRAMSVVRCCAQLSTYAHLLQMAPSAFVRRAFQHEVAIDSRPDTSPVVPFFLKRASAVD